MYGDPKVQLRWLYSRHLSPGMAWQTLQSLGNNLHQLCRSGLWIAFVLRGRDPIPCMLILQVRTALYMAFIWIAMLE